MKPDAKLAYTVTHAAELLDISPDFFRDYVLPDVKIVYRGRKRLVPRSELEKWLEREARQTS